MDSCDLLPRDCPQQSNWRYVEASSTSLQRFIHPPIENTQLGVGVQWDFREVDCVSASWSEAAQSGSHHPSSQTDILHCLSHIHRVKNELTATICREDACVVAPRNCISAVLPPQKHSWYVSASFTVIHVVVVVSVIIFLLLLISTLLKTLRLFQAYLP